MADHGLLPTTSPLLPHVATNAALQATASTTYPTGVWRDDFATGNGAPPLFYVPSSTAPGPVDNGYVVASSDGKYWVAKFPSGRLDVRHWGCKGDGVADNSTAFAAVLAYAKLAVGCVAYFPTGIYVFGSAISFSFPNSMLSMTIEGDSQDATVLEWTNASGGMSFTWNNQENSFHLRNLAITTNQANGGTGLALLNTTVYGGFVEATQSDITNVTFQGFGGDGPTPYWSTACNIQAVTYVNFTNVLIYGGENISSVPEGTGVQLSDYAGVITANFVFTGCSFIDLNAGMEIAGDAQGIMIQGCSFVDNTYGILKPNGVVEVEGVQITNSNFASKNAGIQFLSQVNDFQLIGSTFFVNDTSGSYSGVNLGDVARATIIGNNFVAPSPTPDAALIIDQTNGWPITALGNIFSGSFATGIDLTSNSSEVVLTGNQYESTITTPVSNGGTNAATNIVDARQSWTPILQFGGVSTGITYAAQTGTYNEANGIVTAQMQITLSSSGSATGNVTITGWPAGGSFGYSSMRFSNFGMTGVSGGVTGYLLGPTANLTTQGASGEVALTNANFTNGSEIICTVSYPRATI